MIDCSKTENYFKEKTRMTKRKAGSICGIRCTECPLYGAYSGENCGCAALQHMHPDKAIAIVQRWSDEHPQKTYKDDFLEKFPNALTEADGAPKCCRNNVYGFEKRCGTISRTECYKCWNEVMPE